jgi:fructoselysine-6-P-deglycase FrlB-like protein
VPELRSQPPWLMEEMVAAEPSLVEPILGTTDQAEPIAKLIERAADEKTPIVVTGCGTSETAAMAIRDLLADALRRCGVEHPVVHARQALEASLEPWSGGVCLGITHEGGTHATILALVAARAEGAATAGITARRESAVASVTDRLLVTPIIDRSWCHTVGYLSPILAGAAIASAVDGSPADAPGLTSALREALGRAQEVRRVAESLFGVTRLMTVAAGADRSPAKELALKIEEGVWLPARMLELETALHGHLAAADDHTGMIVIATDERERLVTRTRMVVEAARRIGIRVGLIAARLVAEKVADGGVPTVILPETLGRYGLLGRFTGAAIALQQLTLALSRLAGTNPDQIRRQQGPYREAAKVTEGSSW